MLVPIKSMNTLLDILVDEYITGLNLFYCVKEWLKWLNL